MEAGEDGAHAESVENDRVAAADSADAAAWVSVGSGRRKVDGDEENEDGSSTVAPASGALQSLLRKLADVIAHILIEKS